MNKCPKLVHQSSLSKFSKYSHWNLLRLKLGTQSWWWRRTCFSKELFLWVKLFLHVKQWRKGKRQTLSQASSHDFLIYSVQKYGLQFIAKM